MRQISIKGSVVPDQQALIYDWFGLDCISPNNVKKVFDDANGEDVEVTLTTNGGSVFAGQEIYDIIKSYSGKKSVKISGLVASIGTLITCAFDEVSISSVGTFMIHNPTLGEVSGERKDMEQAAQLLLTVETTILNAYEARTGFDREGLAEMMASEKFMTAEETVSFGFADKINDEEKELTLVASLDPMANNTFIQKLEKIMNKEKQEAESAKTAARLRLLSLQEGNQ